MTYGENRKRRSASAFQTSAQCSGLHLSSPSTDMVASYGEASQAPPDVHHASALATLASIKTLFAQVQKQDQTGPVDAAYLMRQLEGILSKSTLTDSHMAPTALIKSDDHLLGQYVIDREGMQGGRVVSVMMRPSGHVVQLDNGRVIALSALLFELKSNPQTGECTTQVLLAHPAAPALPSTAGEGETGASRVLHTSFGGEFGGY